MPTRTRLGRLSCWCIHLSLLWLLRGTEALMDYSCWRFVDVCWQQAKRSIVLPNALLRHPGTHDLIWRLFSLLMICSEERDTYSHSSRAIINHYVLFTRMSLSCHSSFSKSLSVPLSCSVHTLSFIINMLFTNSHSSHSGMHEFTCM